MLNLDLRQIINKYQRIILPYKVGEVSRVPENTCSEFYNEVVRFNNNSFNPFWNSNLSGSMLEKRKTMLLKMVGTAQSIARTCSYSTKTELLEHEMYNEMFSLQVELYDLMPEK